MVDGPGARDARLVASVVAVEPAALVSARLELGVTPLLELERTLEERLLASGSLV